MTINLKMFATAVPMALALPLLALAAPAIKVSEEYAEFYDGDTTKGIDFVQSIRVLAPAYGSNVKGDITVVFEAPGMTVAKARCRQQPTEADPDPRGHDVTLAEQRLGDDATGSFVFPADEFPNGPLTIRIQAKDDRDKQDYCELQIFNLYTCARPLGRAT